MNKAFIGMSLESRAFTKDWLAFAMRSILSTHDALLVVLADELMTYTRAFRQGSSGPTVRLADSRLALGKTAGDRLRYVEGVTASLDSRLRSRVRIATWSEVADAEAMRLLRCLSVARRTASSVRRILEAVATDHLNRIPARIEGADYLGLCTDYILEEAAVCLRITECLGFSSEYYPGQDNAFLAELYRGGFDPVGLSVPELVGHPATRQFTSLRTAKQSAHESPYVS